MSYFIAGLLLLCFWQTSFAAPGKKPSSNGMSEGPPMSGQVSSTRSAKGSGRSYLFEVVSGTYESFAHGEWYLKDEAGFGLEIGSSRNMERLPREQTEKYNESLTYSSQEVLLTVSRYSRSEAPGGFYWLLGLGYQQAKASWKKASEPADKRVSLADTDGFLHHDLVGEGTTAHVRLGYRYVAESWPFSVGGFVGGKHFEPKFKDKNDTESNTETKLSPTESKERGQLQRIVMTDVGLGLELGLAF